MAKYEVLIVDDDFITLTLLKEALKEFNVLTVSSPLDCLKAVEALEEPPYLIILDLMMPEMSGFELCTKLINIVDTEQTDIIFHTANSDLEERLKGFEVGASDFLVKPIEVPELQKKARHIVSRGIERESIKAQSDSHSQLIETVMTDLGEQGILIHFFRTCSKTYTVDALLELIVRTGEDFGIKSSVQVKYELNHVEYCETGSTDTALSELEKELHDRLTVADRIMTRGNRLFLNYEPFTQIIKNMPSDAERAGRYRDHLAIVLETAVSQLQTIIQADEVDLMIQELEVVQAKCEEENINRNRGVMEALTGLVAKLESRIFDYGLIEQQENELLELFKQSTDKAYETIDNARSTQELKLIMSRLRALREMNQSNKENQVDTQRVELF
ncbi:MAG: response regulator [Alteromonadaceae bacterium]|nr:response regulator [Alteromonadaceae bacterium]